jgi:hypothetical protein
MTIIALLTTSTRMVYPPGFGCEGSLTDIGTIGIRAIKFCARVPMIE